MFLSIAYYTRLNIAKVKIKNIIIFLDSHCLGLGYESHFDNSYNFSKKYLTILKIL